MVGGSTGPWVAQRAGYYGRGVASSESEINDCGFVGTVWEVGEGS